MRKYEKPNLRVERWEEEDEVFTTNDGVYVSLQPGGDEDFDGDDVLW